MRLSLVLLALTVPTLLSAQVGQQGTTTDSRYLASPQPNHPIFSEGRRTMFAERLDDGERVTLDGRLDEGFWDRVEPAGDFIMQEPDLGGTPTERTEVRIAFDADNLYMGVTAYDSEPDKLMGNTMKRDEFLSADDRFMWTMDPFLDQQSGYFFEMNPSGLMADAQKGASGQNNREWDGIWDARVFQGEFGYSIEIVIPFSTLNFDPQAPAWGINFQRTVRRKNEETLWTGHQRNQGLQRMTNAGLLVGIREVTQGVGLDVRPYAVAKLSEAPGRVPARDGDGSADMGLDLFYSITPTLRANLTINTDFAETEVDQRQVNLTRFPLFFPEKRAFFLEGQTFFDMFTPPEIRPFFSRRIGLNTGVAQPIDAGLKLMGQIGRNDVGALVVRTRETDALQGEDFAVLRARRRFWSQSSVGGVYTMRQAREDELGAWHTFGLDAQLSTSSFLGDQNLSGGVLLLATPGPGIDEDYLSYSAVVQYPNDVWNAMIYALVIEPNVNPAVGFLRRSGFRSYNPNITFSPRPTNHPLIRRFSFGGRMTYLTDMEHSLLTREINLTAFSVDTHSGDNFSINVMPTHERLERAFQIYPGVVLPEGATYDFTRYSVSAGTANRRILSVGTDYTWGGFFSGERQDASLSLGFRPMPGITINSTAERNEVELPEGDFTTHVFRFVADTQFNPRVYIVNNIQYDTLSEQLGWQGRFRWTVRPGSDFYFVYTHNWLEDPGLDGRLNQLYTLDRQAAMKFSYTRRI